MLVRNPASRHSGEQESLEDNAIDVMQNRGHRNSSTKRPLDIDDDNEREEEEEGQHAHKRRKSWSWGTADSQAPPIRLEPDVWNIEGRWLGYAEDGQIKMEFGIIASNIEDFTRKYATKEIGQTSLRRRFEGTQKLEAALRPNREVGKVLVMEAFPALESHGERDTLTAETLLERDHAAVKLLVQARLHRFVSDRITSNPFYFLEHHEYGGVHTVLQRIFQKLEKGR